MRRWRSCETSTIRVSQVVDFFDEKRYYMAIELMEGGELFERIVKKTFYNEMDAGLSADFTRSLRTSITRASCTATSSPRTCCSSRRSTTSTSSWRTSASRAPASFSVRGLLGVMLILSP